MMTTCRKRTRISTVQQDDQLTSCFVPVLLIDNNDIKRCVKCKLHSGADGNVISFMVYDSLRLYPLHPCKIINFMVGNSTVNPPAVATVELFLQIQ